MKLSRPFISVGDCIAVTHLRGHNKGKAVYTRPSAKFAGEKWSAYRLSYHLNIAEIDKNPPNMKEGFILHTCDNEWCVNPDHLYLGTQKQNIKDMFDRSDARNKLSIIGLKRRNSPTTNLAISKSLRGKPKSDDHKRNISSARKNFFKLNPDRKDENSSRARDFWKANPELMTENMKKMRSARK